MWRVKLISIAFVFVAGACSGPSTAPEDGARDALPADAGPADGRVDAPDAALRIDIGVALPAPDAAPDVQADPAPDAGPVDATVHGGGASPLPPAPADGAPGRYVAVEQARYPHDARAFTQGLLVAHGELYESTGLRGRSSLRRVDLESGTVQHQVDLDDPLFGEGLALVGNRLIQLTWQAGIALVYDRATFEEVARWPYRGEGWGLAWDGRRLIHSDGSSTLRFYDPDGYTLLGSVDVLDRGVPVPQLNELEYVEGEVLANVWMTDSIVRIDPETGRVLGWIDLAHLRPESTRRVNGAVLNGIAWDSANERLLVTGKLWPVMYAIDVVDADADADADADEDADEGGDEGADD